MEEEGTRQFSSTFSLREFQRNLQQITRKRDILLKNGITKYWKQQLPALLGDESHLLKEALQNIENADNLAANLQGIIDNIMQFCKLLPLETMRLHKEARQKRWWENLSVLFNNLGVETAGLSYCLQRLYQLLTQDLELAESDTSLRQLKAVLTQIEAGRQFLEDFFSKPPDDEQVYWLTNEPQRPDLKLYITPLKTNRQFEELLFSAKYSVVLTSATLSVNNDFSYLMEQLGIPADLTDLLQIPSPFLYDEQVKLLVDTSLPEPNLPDESEYNLALQQSLFSLLKVTKGGTMVLFTSRKQMRQMSEYLYEPLQEMGLELFADGVNGNRINLVNELKDNPQAVVFGTNTFWEGIDLPGESLTAVIIVRLPFAPPNLPLVEAKMEELAKEGKDGFYNYSLPQAILRFRQGYGRLIRTMDDCGVVVVLDKRVLCKKYGKLFIRSLPSQKYEAGPTSYLMEQISKWFASLHIKK